MDCDNKKCYWNYENQCVCECEEPFISGRPNSMNCSNFLSSEFERKMINDYNICNWLAIDIKEGLRKLNRHKLRKYKMLLSKLLNEMKEDQNN